MLSTAPAAPRRCAEDALQRRRLLRVADHGRGAVGVDVADLPRTEAGVVEGQAHRPGAALSLGSHVGDVVGVGGEAESAELAVDLGPPAAGVLVLLQDQGPRPFAEDEAGSVGVEGPARPLRLVVAHRQGPGRGEAGHGQGRDGGLGAAGDHDVGVAVLDLAPRLADGVSRRGTGGDGGVVGAPGAKLDGDHPRRHVADDHGDEEGAQAPRTAVAEHGVLVLEGGDAADAGAEDDAHALGLQAVHVEAGVGEGLGGRIHAVLDESVVAANLLAVEAGLGVEVLDLPRDGDLLAGGVEAGDRPDAGTAVGQGVPVGDGIVAVRGQHPETCDHYSPSRHVDRRLRPWRSLRGSEWRR